MARNSMKKVIHMADQLRKFSKQMSNTNKSPVFEAFTNSFADNVRERLLRGVAHGFDINGHQFKKHSKVTTWARANPKGSKQFGGSGSMDEATIEAYKSEGMAIPKSTAERTTNVGKYSFSNKPNGTILYGGKSVGNSIPELIGKDLESSKVVIPGKTIVTVTDSGAKPYQQMHNTGGTVNSNKWSEKFNTAGKDTPRRQWAGVPKTYRENHPGWRNEMQKLAMFLKRQFGKVVKGGKASLVYTDKRKARGQ